MDNIEGVTENDYAPNVEDAPESQNIELIQNEKLESQPDQDGEKDNGETQDGPEIQFDLEEKWKHQKKRLSKAQREKHRIAAELEQAKQEIEQLKAYSQTFNHAAQYHHENALKTKLDTARENLRKAIELNDSDAIVNANEELADVKSDMKALESHKANLALQQHYANSYNAQNNYQTEPDYNEYTDERAEKWLRNNAWFDQKSPNFDPDKAEEVRLYAQQLDTLLQEEGRENEAFSNNYFNKIDRFSRMYDQERNVSHSQRVSNLSNVSPVKRGSLQQNGKIPKISLSEDEKIMARNAKVSEADWLKAKLEDIKQQQIKMQNNQVIY